jgi:4-hydroxy-tetrahydrodipicolinate synthase
MNAEKLRGVVVPVITPITENEEVDEPAFRAILGRLVRAGVHAIFVGGSAGEGPLLTDPEWRRMTEIALDEVDGRAALLGGVMDTSARRVSAKISQLRKLGYRYCVLTPTYYVATKAATEHLRLFGQAKEAAGDMELIAYNIPQCTGSILAVDTICEMVSRGWIRYCKESSGDWSYLGDLIERGKSVGLTVLAGDEATSGEALLAGAQGIVPVCANYDPQTYLRLFDAGQRGDRNEVACLMQRVMLLRETLPMSGAAWLAGIKYALAALGIGSGRPVSPLEPAEAARMANIRALIEADRAEGRLQVV